MVLPLAFLFAGELAAQTQIPLTGPSPAVMVYGVIGYYGEVIVIRGQWGPCFALATGTFLGCEQITNNEHPGWGRFPGVLVDKHGCCMSMSIHADGQLYVFNDGTERPQAPNTVVFSLLPVPQFQTVYDSGGDWAGTMGAQASDPRGFTWRQDGAFATGFSLYRNDAPGPTPVPVTPEPTVVYAPPPTEPPLATPTPGSGTICGPVVSGQCYYCATGEPAPCPIQATPTPPPSPTPTATPPAPTAVPPSFTPTPTDVPSATPTAEQSPTETPLAPSPTATATAPSFTPTRSGGGGGCSGGKSASGSLGAGLAVGLALLARRRAIR
jgi:hypothetical protein